jgi:uncharacterized protein YcgI (DUF1989 family)
MATALSSKTDSAGTRRRAERVEQSIVLPARRGKAVRLRAGRRLRLVNPYGVQAVDLWAFVDGDIGEHLSMEHFRSVHSTIFATVDTPLVSNAQRPLLTIIEDTSSGRHDTLLCPCNEPLYRQLGAKPGHRSCTDNLHEGLGELGLVAPFTPASLNLFMSVEVRPDGSLERRLPSSKPGSYLVLRAEVDVVIAFSCCPQDITPINGPERTPRDCLIEILAPTAENA